MPRHQPGRSRRRRPSPDALARIHPDAAGIDCGASSHYVAVPPDRDAAPVQSFATFTRDLHRLADWLQACRVTHVAMESTGVYWIPVFEILEARGFQVILVNARHVKNVPGRKTDVSDCEWIRDLHIMGLLRGSFRPAQALAALRAYLRHRSTLIETAAVHTQRMQKALLEMNLQLPRVLSDVCGATGLAIIRAIAAGERDAAALARHRDYRCHATAADLIGALTGHYRDEHLCVLRQNLTLYDTCQTLIAECDATIEQALQTLAADAAPAAAPLPPARDPHKKARDNEPRFDVRTLVHRVTGHDLSQIDGIGPYSALRLISEIGTDMSRWPTAHHFTSWLTLAPQNKISGGRLLSSRTAPSANRAAAILRMAAVAAGRTQTALGAFYRRLGYRIGKAKAVTATARKLAILVYHTLRHDMVYTDPGAAAYDHEHRRQVLRGLRRRAATLGFDLVDRSTGELAGSTVS